MLLRRFRLYRRTARAGVVRAVRRDGLSPDREAHDQRWPAGKSGLLRQFVRVKRHGHFHALASGAVTGWRRRRALPTRGGSGNGAQASTAAAIQGHSPRPTAPAPPALPPTIPGALTSGPPTGPASTLPGPVITRNAPAQNSRAQAVPNGDGPMTSAAIAENPSSTPDPRTIGGVDDPLVEFPYFPLYTLDYAYAYYSPCYQRYRSSGPVPIPDRRTEGLIVSKVDLQGLLMRPPLERWRVAA